ncbi:Stage III sporulation protein AH [compost metagenome]
MKGKRQTIWLVSMLSLMVVLSAYYLFTEDTGASIPKETAGSIQVDTANNGTGGSDTTTLDNGLVINEVDTSGALAADAGSETAAVTDDSSTAAVTDPAAVTDDSSTSTAAAEDKSSTAAVTGGDSDKKATAGSEATTEIKDSTKTDTAVADKDSASSEAASTPVKGDDEILKEVAAQSSSASSLFTNYLFERDQQNIKDYNDLMAQINDMDKTPAENAVAQEQLNRLEEKESKINDIETQLQQKYGQAIVKEETGDSYTVVVLSDKLDVKQAVGIVDLVMKELSVTQDKIRVQYVSEQ